MFIVTDVSHRFLFWASVKLKAEADMSLTAQRLKVGGWVNTAPRPPALETRVLRVKAGETFIIIARKTHGLRTGERVPLDRVAHQRPISRKWQTIETA